MKSVRPYRIVVNVINFLNPLVNFSVNLFIIHIEHGWKGGKTDYL